MLQKIFLAISITTSLFSFMLTKPALAQNPPILITEVQAGFTDAVGLEYPKREFIEISNVSSSSFDMTDWRVEYLSAAHTGNGAPTTILATFSGWLPIGGKALFSHSGYVPGLVDRVFGEGDSSASGLLAKSGGHIRLMNGSYMVDCVAWGSASVIEGCDKVGASSPAGHSIQRPLDQNGNYDKLMGVKNLQPISPHGGDLYDPRVVSEPTDPNDPDIPSQEPEEPSQTCQAIKLSEVVANPAGDDTAGEFIELHNPTGQTQPLLGCSLKVSARQYVFTADQVLQAGEYKAYYYTATGLPLTNSGSEVKLVLTSSEQATTYPALADDIAWADVGGRWQTTNIPTPNAPNLLPTSEPDETVLMSNDPCPAGKYRNPETNRCKNIETDTDITPCTPGQQRSPETGRCRKIITASTGLAVCDVGEERNPATNRCRKITATQATVKPCETGQERNPETNRCRKAITATANGGEVDDSGSGTLQNYKILIIVLLLVLAYVIYEYRQEIARAFNTVKLRLVKRGDK